MLRALFKAATTPARLLVVTTLLGVVLRIVSSMMLTRLLSPDVFGIAALMTSTFVVITLLSDLGIGPYVIRHTSAEDPDFLNAVWTVQVLRGLVMFSAGCLLATPVSLLLGHPELAWPLMVASISLLIDSAASLSMYLAIRNSQSNRLAVLDVALQVVQIVITVIAAYYLRSIWAIVIGIISLSTLRLLASYFIIGTVRHKFLHDKTQRDELWKFSRYILASSVITLCMSQVDKFVMSQLMSLSELGLYALGASIAVTPQGFLAVYSHRILYPIYTSTWQNNPSQLRQTYADSRRRMSWLYGFAVGGLIGGALLVVRILFDPRYEDAAMYLSLLAIPSAMMMATRAMNEVMTAIGEVRFVLRANIARLIWLVGAGTIAIYFFGAWGFVLVLAPTEVPPYLYGLWRLKKNGLLDIKEEIAFLSFIAAGVAIGWFIARLPIFAGL